MALKFEFFKLIEITTKYCDDNRARSSINFFIILWSLVVYEIGYKHREFGDEDNEYRTERMKW